MGLSKPSARITGLLSCLAVLQFSTAIFAKGSGGHGGPIGEREDWPCDGCLFQAPDDMDPNVPTPIMVTFHGDEGKPSYIHNSFKNAANDAGFLLLSLMCPESEGCQNPAWEYPGSWYRWRASDDHNPLWVGLQVDAVEEEYNVDVDMEYLAGFSGGSIYISWYMLEFSDRFAGGNFLGGGSQQGSCFAECETPAYFLIGSEDFLINGARKMHDYLEECGHEVLWDEVPGVDHSIIRDNLPAMFDWFSERPYPCNEEDTDSDTGSDTDTDADTDTDTDIDTDTDTDADTDTDTDTDSDSDSDADTDSDTDSDADSDSDSDSDSDGDGDQGNATNDESGCGCSAVGQHSNSALFSLIESLL
ncbi:MAG: hypothetical protein QNJ97_12615 [Myxococcota bacterium]|nr:hypothetical protein [Myxococcota bacterium]